MHFLITAGPTREPIDPVRYIGNRSSGRMGLALAHAAVNKGHKVTLVLGPVSIAMPHMAGVKRVDVESSQQMQDAVMAHFDEADVLIMAAAVADYRPKKVSAMKLGREGSLTIELEGTTDIVAAASAKKQSDQRTIGFSLEHEGALDRARSKMTRKKLDLMVFNPTETMNADTVQATLLYPDGRMEPLAVTDKQSFADVLIDRAEELF